MRTHLPTVAALESDDQNRLDAELRVAEVRLQLAVVRMLTDEVERATRPGDTRRLAEQVVEEVARLGCRLLEAAAAVTGSLCHEAGGVLELLSPPPAVDGDAAAE